MGSFVYGVPIPLSYLLSETRIRVIIIEHGWLQGIRAIFQSSGGIKQSKINEIVESCHNETPPIGKFLNVSKKNTTNNQKKCLSSSDFESISKGKHIVQVHYNAKKDEIKNKLSSKSTSYNHAIHPSSSECSDSSYGAQHKMIDDIESKLKNTAICKSSSYNPAVHPSTSKCSDTSHNAQSNNADEIEVEVERTEISDCASYYRAIRHSTSEDSDISYISKRKPADGLDLRTLVVSNVRPDADVVISMQPENDLIKNPMQPGIDIIKDLKVNRKSDFSSHMGDNADLDTIKLLSIVDFQYHSTDAINIIGVDSDVGGTNPLYSVVCSTDSMDAITVICLDYVDSDVEDIEQLSSEVCCNAKKDEIKNKLSSKSTSYNHAIHPSSSECSDSSYGAQHKMIDDIESKLKNTAICKSSSYNPAVHPSTSKCSDTSHNAQSNNADEIEVEVERTEISDCASYYRAIRHSTSEDSDISYISKRKPADGLDLRTLVVSNVRPDADVVISMQPENDLIKNPMQPGIDIIKDLKVNRKSDFSSHMGDNADLDTIKLLSIVDFQYHSTDAINIIGVDSDVGGTNPLYSVVCSTDSMDAITVICLDYVDSDVEDIEQLSSEVCCNDSREPVFRECVDSDEETIERLASLETDSVELLSYKHSASDEKSFQILSSVEGRKDATKPKLLVNMDVAVIKSVFFEQSNKIISILGDANFRIFSRSYILKRTLQYSNSNVNESDYQKCFQCLCDLESYPPQCSDNNDKTHFLVSLINAWYLSKCQNMKKCENVVSKCDTKAGDSLNLNTIEGDNASTERKRILNSMLLNVRCDLEYSTLLELLYIHEEERREEQLVYGW